MRFLSCLFMMILSASHVALASDVDWKIIGERFEYENVLYSPEADPSAVQIPDSEIKADMAPYLSEFESQGPVTIYLGFGYQVYQPVQSYFSVVESLKAAAEEMGLNLTNVVLNEDGSKLSFTNSATGIAYVLQMGSTLEDYAAAYSSYDVVMYHGHSRYGRGPAFGSFSNYFRMGNVFKTIEVEANNPYFLTEPTALTKTYPVKHVTLSGKTYEFQYHGEKIKTADLGPTGYTRNILGFDADLKKTTFKQGRQLFYLNSCTNVGYFRDPIRALFPSTDQKIVFGTKQLGKFSVQPDVAFILSLVTHAQTSKDVTDELDRARTDCSADGCFVAY